MFDGISWIGVLVAGFVGTLSGGLWFGPKTFFPLWWRLMGHPEGSEIKPGGNVPMGVVFGATFLAQVVQAAAMAVVINLATRAGLTTSFGVVDGLLVGFVVGVGFAASAPLGHRLFGGHGFGVWALEVSNDVLNCVLMGGILAYAQA